jgi:glycerophosphoryl diester phosphodiesterase
MDSEKSILNEIAEIRNSDTKLYSYLYDLAYESDGSNDNFIEKILDSFLSDERTEIKSVSIYGLLFGLKIRKEKYKEFALTNIIDEQANFDLRLKCISSVSEAYQGSKDNLLLETLFNTFYKNEEDSDIKTESFIGMMKLMNYTSVEIMRKNQNTVIISFDDININQFKSEIDKIIGIISTN